MRSSDLGISSSGAGIAGAIGCPVAAPAIATGRVAVGDEDAGDGHYPEQDHDDEGQHERGHDADCISRRNATQGRVDARAFPTTGRRQFDHGGAKMLLRRRRRLDRISGRSRRSWRPVPLADAIIAESDRARQASARLDMVGNWIGFGVAASLLLGAALVGQRAVRPDAGGRNPQCDATRIAQVLNHLLSNAIKYSPDGGRIAVDLRIEGGAASVSVVDEGIGIAPEDQRHLFAPFRRTQAARESAPGVGLGLSVARRIVRAHGGEIDVQSGSGAGSTFRVRVPMASEQDVAGVGARPAPDGDGGAPGVMDRITGGGR